jgi:hypothetical protein
MDIDGVRGPLITADHTDYDTARAVWNGAVDRRPRLIARCSGTAYVAALVRFARDRDLEIADRHPTSRRAQLEMGYAASLGDAQQDAHIAAIRRGDPAVADLSVLNCRGHTACMATKKRGPKSPMTAAHKAALAAGRNGSRIVKNYLDALDSNRPKRGRKRTPASIQQRLGEIDARLADADPLSRLNLYQERMNLHTELEAMEAKVDLTALEDDFVSVAYEYSSRRGISYAAWREAGVGASVLRRAGITRSM